MRKFLKFFFIAAMSLSAASFVSSCDDDNETLNPAAEIGITNQSWDLSNTITADGQGGTINLTFTAAGTWKASCGDQWCKITPTSGREGNSQLTVTLERNTTGAQRTATVMIRIESTGKSLLIKIVQGTTTQGGDGTYTSVNEWMFNYMKEKYLWNEPLQTLQPDKSLSYDKFLTSVLDAVDADNHRNRDDGHWVNGKREYYYSFIESDAPVSKSAGEEETGSGITYMELAQISNTAYAILPAMVAPGTPAAQAGIKRGDIIIKVNNTALTSTNLSNLTNRVYDGGVTVTLGEPQFDDEGYLTSITTGSTISLASATYTDPAIYQSSVLELSGGKKAGYLAYMGFHTSYDAQLIDIFNQFKSQGITDLILDLRYNGGGHVLSSVLLATLITGDAYKGQLYSRTTYNAARAAKGEVGEYRLGTASTPEGNYSKLTEALSASVNLKTIYVITSENTASASELIINGLRGLDLTVNLIGTTTNGKNVGMEAMQSTIGNYTYLFAPITFYSENAKGFKDYADGFTPDVEFDDSQYLLGDFGTSDDILSKIAFLWIVNGNKPNLSMSRANTFGTTVRKIKSKSDRTPVQYNGMIAFPEDKN